MFKLLTRILLLTLAAALTVPATAAPAQKSRWEQVETAPGDLSEELAVVVRDNYIYVTVYRPTAVKLFTILGQPVSQVTLPAGTSRFKVAARGIYILKAGSTTRRITI
ncbi:MAG: hypothetical protein HFJ87_07005 [Muribaculaceae bacterium]|nr:hypothetical protein [Muribaculaceae bacterium]